MHSVYFLIFISGLLGGFSHCAAMCGPLVLGYSLQVKGAGYAPHLLFNLGRLTTYGIIGGAMGLTGSFLGVAGPLKAIQDIAPALAGLIIVLIGLGAAGWLPKIRLTESGGPLSWLTARFLKVSAETGGSGAYFPMGLIVGFLPCGLLYTAFIAAAGSGVEAPSQVGGFLKGVFILLLFGAGTMPALFLLGRLASGLSLRFRGLFQKATALISITLGAVFILRALLP